MKLESQGFLAFLSSGQLGVAETLWSNSPIPCAWQLHKLRGLGQPPTLWVLPIKCLFMWEKNTAFEE